MKRTGHYRMKPLNFLDASKFAHLLVSNGDESASRRRQKTFEFKLLVFPHSTGLKYLALGWRKIKYDRPDPLTD